MACDIAEMSGYVGNNSIQVLRDALLNMDVSGIPDCLSLPSLSAGYCKVGDILALPMGSLVLTKAINGDACGLRSVLNAVAIQQSSTTMFYIRV